MMLKKGLTFLIGLSTLFVFANVALADWNESKVAQEKAAATSRLITTCKTATSGGSGSNNFIYEKCEIAGELFDAYYTTCTTRESSNYTSKQQLALACFNEANVLTLTKLRKVGSSDDSSSTVGGSTNGTNGNNYIPGGDSGSGNSTTTTSSSKIDLGEAQSSAGNCGSPDLVMVNGQCSGKSLFCKEGSNSPVCAGSLMGMITLILYIMLGFAAFVAVAFIIVGGYRYMTAGGNSEQATSGRTTVVNAVIGLVLVMMAYMLVTVVIRTLINPTGFFG